MNQTASFLPILSMTVGKNFLKFANVAIDMFWLYKFHTNNYTTFMSAFTDNLDIMA